MAAAAWGSHGLLDRLLRGMKFFWKVNQAGEEYFSYMGSAIATLLSVAIGGIVYLILVLAFRIISKEDLELMPKGEKIARLLRIR